ncbi:lysis protein [Salmonella enterica]|nr:lysis protein [Salmonella enterica]
MKYKSQRGTAAHSLKLANETITDMQIHQHDVSALDARYTKELADAKAENDALQRRLAAGGRVRDEGRLQCLPQLPALAVWVMLASSNSPRGLDRTFPISGPELSATRKN